MKISRPMTTRIGRMSGISTFQKVCQWRGAVHDGRFVQIAWDRVEVALGQPGVDAQNAAQIDEQQAAMGVDVEKGNVGRPTAAG